MRRSELRTCIFKLVFRKEFYPVEELKEQMQLFFDCAAVNQESEADTEFVESRATEEDMAYIVQKTTAILEHLPEIDVILAEASEGWRLGRLGKAELAVLRLAVYEMRYDEEVPMGVAINEAVELARTFGTDTSARFVNGVLAKIVNP